MILAPDNFEGTIAESYTAATWATAEAAGLVCLPVVGYRSGNVYSSDKFAARSSGLSVRLITESK